MGTIQRHRAVGPGTFASEEDAEVCANRLRNIRLLDKKILAPQGRSAPRTPLPVARCKLIFPLRRREEGVKPLTIGHTGCESHSFFY